MSMIFGIMATLHPIDSIGLGIMGTMELHGDMDNMRGRMVSIGGSLLDNTKVMEIGGRAEIEISRIMAIITLIDDRQNS